MLRTLVTMMTRRWYAVVAVLVVVAAVGLYVRSQPATYEDDVIVVLLSPSNAGQAVANGYVGLSTNVFNDFSDALPPTGLVLTEEFDNPSVSDQVLTSDGEIRYTFTMTNGYNQQYPRYDQPTMHLTVRGSFPQGVQQTADSALAVAAKELKAMQAASGATRGQLITLKSIYESGPFLANGRPSRVEAGLMIALVGWTIGLVLLAERWSQNRRREAELGAPHVEGSVTKELATTAATNRRD